MDSERVQLGILDSHNTYAEKITALLSTMDQF